MLSALLSICVAAAPELPRVLLDTTPPTQLGAIISVGAGGDLQQALDDAQPGDTVVLAAGATFTGPFTLPFKTGAGWIVVKSSGEANLPACSRDGPTDAPQMAKLLAPVGGQALVTASGAHHWRLEGLEVAAAGFVYNLVQLGNGETSAAALPHDFVIDRCWFHGHATLGTRRGIALNANAVAVVDSYFSQFAEVGADSQALAGWNGAGPFKIVNNHLEGAGENVIFGGADPTIPNLVPADIELRGNHLFKPLSWKVGHPSYAGIHWSVKNLLEFKNARRVLVEGNVLENNWADAQVGMGVLLTPRNQDGSCPWCGVEDVTLRSNVVRGSHGGVNVSGTDDLQASLQTSRVVIEDNLFEGVTYRLFQFLNVPGAAPGGVVDLTVAHNTARVSGNSFATLGDSTAARDQHQGFVFRDNLTEHATYGFFGGGQGEGTVALSAYCAAGWVMTKNAIVGGGSAGAYPPGNFFPVDLPAVGFVDLNAGQYRLGASSPYRGAASDGTDLGADFDALSAATATAVSGATSCPISTDAGVADAGLDAGSPDSGVLAADAGLDAGSPDSGVPASDAGSTDSGVAAPDAGTLSGAQGACGCTSTPAVTGIAALLLVLASRRRKGP